MKRISIKYFCELNSFGTLISRPARTSITLNTIYEGEEFLSILGRIQSNKLGTDERNLLKNYRALVVICDDKLLMNGTKLSLKQFDSLCLNHRIIVGVHA